MVRVDKLFDRFNSNFNVFHDVFLSCGSINDQEVGGLMGSNELGKLLVLLYFRVHSGALCFGKVAVLSKGNKILFLDLIVYMDKVVLTIVENSFANVLVHVFD